MNVASFSAELAYPPSEFAGLQVSPLVGLVDECSEHRSAIPQLLSEHGIAAIPFAGVSELPPLLDNAVLLVADVDKSITKAVRRSTFGSKIIAYAEEIDLQRVVSAIQQGASDYVCWPNQSDAMVHAVRSCMRDIWMNSGGHLSQSEPREIWAEIADKSRVRGGRSPRLTRREGEILKLVSDGGSSAAIGEHLRLSMRTVECHRSNIIRKLGVANMTEAVRFALRHGLIQ